jgi:hypothetical protein
VKVERFTMQPEEGPKKVHDILTCPRYTIDGKKTTATSSTGEQLRGRLAIFGAAAQAADLWFPSSGLGTHHGGAGLNSFV